MFIRWDGLTSPIRHVRSGGLLKNAVVYGEKAKDGNFAGVGHDITAEGNGIRKETDIGNGFEDI